MRYVSDIQANKDAVLDGIREGLAKPDAAHLYQDAIDRGRKAVDQILQFSEIKQHHKYILGVLAESSTDLAHWKTYYFYEWPTFLLALTGNNVPVRTMTAVKQSIDAAFQVMLSDRLEDLDYDRKDSFVVIENVKEIHSIKRSKDGGLIIEFELLN